MTTADLAPAAPTDGREQPLYRVTGVTRTYTQKGRIVKVLTGVDLDIMSGEFVTIQGPTGGGKSTLLQLLGALDTPSTGSLLLDGSELASASSAELTRIRAEEIGFVFQGFNLIPTLTATENVDMALESRGVDRAERRARVAEALAHVGLDDRGDHLPAELSGGQQQRVAIARALVKKPRVLLADEPTGNLDESMRDEILALLESLCVEGITVIVVTHDSAVARRATRRLRLAKGTVRDITREGIAAAP
ncbi:ABC transporter ATP-binding protein [Microbacterium sp. Ag1]|uniref:ABC transporter ATP-binding protein n=1 Tax=Microbacterium sp. Ag1 TaxID=1643443 RepID=UPI000629B923|nr:ABC transporter ATP-binding protein [Microbacterium sp. Ag1]KKX97118.1 peptide ABC transporter ATP-binding protein [Microbacterium sp. Ag1]